MELELELDTLDAEVCAITGVTVRFSVVFGDEADTLDAEVCAITGVTVRFSTVA